MTFCVVVRCGAVENYNMVKYRGFKRTLSRPAGLFPAKQSGSAIVQSESSKQFTLTLTHPQEIIYNTRSHIY